MGCQYLGVSSLAINGKKKEELIAQDPKSGEIIQPILRGRDIRRYSYEFADLWIITTFRSLKLDIETYSAIKQHFLTFGLDRLKQTSELGSRKKTSNQWFETQDNIAYMDGSPLRLRCSSHNRGGGPLCDHFSVKRAIAKSFEGICTRICSKITGLAMLQFINDLTNKLLNHLKHALVF